MYMLSILGSKYYTRNRIKFTLCLCDFVYNETNNEYYIHMTLIIRHVSVQVDVYAKIKNVLSCVFVHIFTTNVVALTVCVITTIGNNKLNTYR